MCVNYITVSREIALARFNAALDAGEDWANEIYQDYRAPFIIHDEKGDRKALVGSYGFIPQKHKPPGVTRMTTMNARGEEVGTKRHYKKHWLESKLCLVPAMAVYEPNWETGSHVRWAIGVADRAPFAMAGMWRSWEEDNGVIAHSFTQFTMNADDHLLLNRFHRPGEEKRGVVIIRPEDYDDWLSCKNPELARAYLQLLPPEALTAWPEPRKSGSKPAKAKVNEEATDKEQPTLF